MGIENTNRTLYTETPQEIPNIKLPKTNEQENSIVENNSASNLDINRSHMNERKHRSEMRQRTQQQNQAEKNQNICSLVRVPITGKEDLNSLKRFLKTPISTNLKELDKIGIIYRGDGLDLVDEASKSSEYT